MSYPDTRFVHTQNQQKM